MEIGHVEAIFRYPVKSMGGERLEAETVREIGRLAGRSLDIRRFRPNIVVRLPRAVAFQEDEWVESVLSFGEAHDAPALAVTARDIRCVMVNFDPDSADSAPEVLKAVVREHQNTAGIYGAVIRIGRVAGGQANQLPAAAAGPSGPRAGHHLPAPPPPLRRRGGDIKPRHPCALAPLSRSP